VRNRDAGTQLLDEVLDRWEFRERHAIAIDAPTAAVMRAVEEVTWREAPVFRLLVTARGLGVRRPAARQRIIEFFTGPGYTARGGFALLRRAADELVVGVLAPFSTRGTVATGPAQAVFDGFHGPGFKAALNFRFADGRLRTETRVLTTDARSRRRFRLYWTAIRPFSGLTRRSWLRAIRRRVLDVQHSHG